MDSTAETLPRGTKWMPFLAILQHDLRGLWASRLVRLWLARNTYRLGHPDAAQQHIDRMREQAEGLRDWQLVFESEQAAALRGLLEEDVRLVQQLLESQTPLEMLGGAIDRPMVR